jgi:uncharacterized protein with HEPN domain
VRLDREVLGRLQDMIGAIRAIEGVVSGIDEVTFVGDRRSIDAVLWNLTVLGEAARVVPEVVQAAYPEVPWAKMRGLRNFLVHEYFGIDDRIVWATATRNVVPLRPTLERIAAELSAGGAPSA